MFTLVWFLPEFVHVLFKSLYRDYTPLVIGFLSDTFLEFIHTVQPTRKRGQSWTTILFQQNDEILTEKETERENERDRVFAWLQNISQHDSSAGFQNNLKHRKQESSGNTLSGLNEIFSMHSNRNLALLDCNRKRFTFAKVYKTTDLL